MQLRCANITVKYLYTNLKRIQTHLHVSQTKISTLLSFNKQFPAQTCVQRSVLEWDESKHGSANRVIKKALPIYPTLWDLSWFAARPRHTCLTSEKRLFRRRSCSLAALWSAVWSRIKERHGENHRAARREMTAVKKRRECREDKKQTWCYYIQEVWLAASSTQTFCSNIKAFCSIRNQWLLFFHY